MNNGWIKLYRKLLDNDIFYSKPAEWLKIWLYILLKVNYADSKLPKGSDFFRTPWKDITNQNSEAKITKWQWHECIRYLKQTNIITTTKTTRGNIIKVLQYSLYQNEDTTPTNTKPTHQPRQNQHETNTINKEGLRNIKKSTITLSQINNLLSQFPTNLQSLINEYIDIARLENKTEKISLHRQKRLIDELLLLWDNYKGHPIDKADYRSALKITVNNRAPNINYVRKVIKNIVNKRSMRIKGGNK